MSRTALIILDLQNCFITDKTKSLPQKIKNHIESQKYDFILVAEDKEILGFTIANYSPIFKKAVIENLFVIPKFRGQKIGKRLIEEIILKLKNIGCEYICSLTDLDNHVTITFLEEMGFKRGISCAWMDKVLGPDFKR